MAHIAWSCWVRASGPVGPVVQQVPWSFRSVTPVLLVPWSYRSCCARGIAPRVILTIIVAPPPLFSPESHPCLTRGGL